MDEVYSEPVATEAGSDPFAAYLTYHKELATVLGHIGDRPGTNPLDAIPHLDGLAYHRLRQNVSVETRRAYSTFFTSSSLRANLVAPYRNVIARGATVLDPACGVGDLLLAAANLLPEDGLPLESLITLPLTFTVAK